MECFFLSIFASGKLLKKERNAFLKYEEFLLMKNKKKKKKK